MATWDVGVRYMQPRSLKNRASWMWIAPETPTKDGEVRGGV
jgi:hypothetical protein